MVFSIAKFLGQLFVAGAGAYAVAYGLGGASEALAEATKGWSDDSSDTSLRTAANG